MPTSPLLSLPALLPPPILSPLPEPFSAFLPLFLNALFMLALSYYLAQNLQWYNYSLRRVFFKHQKPRWHAFYFALPLILFAALGESFFPLSPIYLIALFLWGKRLDKRLVFTSRIKRFFTTYACFLALGAGLVAFFDMDCRVFFISLFVALAISEISEAVIMKSYEKLALEKLSHMRHTQVIAITASFGKTSIKNFTHALLSKRFKIYATPRSVNTINGIIGDINNALPKDCEVYIVEAGARERGDVGAIARLLEPQYAVIGEIGEAHLQYFKTLENIKNTKYELLQSPRLKELFLYKDNEIPAGIGAGVVLFPPEVREIRCDLEGVEFELKIKDKFVRFKSRVLGRFNISNLAAAILIAQRFGAKIDELKDAVAQIAPVEHRLEKMEVNGKIILDDSFNGNLGGMREAIRLASLHRGGKKIIVTPGLVETSEANNTTLAFLIDSVFDIAIITGEANSRVLAAHINAAQKVVIKDKVNLNGILSRFCKEGDLILFANDAPNYV